jgi:hypothetical protein
VVGSYIYGNNNTGEPAFSIERNWQLFKPSDKREEEARCTYRAALWMNKRHATQQIAVPSSDVVAATISAKHGIALMVLTYDVKSTSLQAASEEQLQTKSKTIEDAHDGVRT